MRAIVVFLILCLSSSVYGQLAEEITFSEKQFDFGTVKEEDGPIIHEFKFINNSEKPISILNVKASCGCTTPDWSKEPVAPGESGFVQAQYNPRNRPGQFNKSLTITTDYNDQPIRLYIKGNVTPKPKSIEEELPVSMNGLRVKYRSLNMGKVYTTDEPTVKTFEVYNDTDSAITFKQEMEGPKYISVSFEPQTLEPKAKGQISVSYNGKLKNDLGFSNDNLNFYTDQSEDLAQKSVSVFATVLEYFPPLTPEEMEDAPKLKIESTTHDFGKISKDSKVNTKFVLTNTGQSPLKIRKVDSNCDCTTAEVEKETVKPGKSVELEVAFDAYGRKGNQQKSVTIYSNDPRNPVQRVTIKTYVQAQ
ncbi:DUF1573 domain-containing protein [Fulvivirga sp. RKSG066]|uniref:DUF1573 domain-containing protein n=1 Tax=Fulvivirga aurantia TaxID=2529383 RepID=UPI0012BC4EE6|nr:DUF1573 domain-containing protein [Fulvivirga aurantia]MTI22046.1 DUF1573 domain-containing protein [Fulvivirga aurantia]